MPVSSILSQIGKTLDNAGQAGDDAVNAAKAVTAKRQMVDTYLNSTKGNTGPTPFSPITPSPSPKDKVGRGKYGSRPGEQRIDTSAMMKPLGSFKKGGHVKKTGVYKLHKGERVLNRRQTAQMDMAKRSGSFGMLSGMDEDGESEGGYERGE